MELFNHLLLRSSEKAVTEVSCISAHLVSFFLFFLSMVQYVNSSCSSLIFNHHSISKLIISLTLTLLQGYFFNCLSVDFIYTGSVDLTLGFLLCMKSINLNGLQSARVAGLLFLLITSRVTAIARLARNRYMFCCRPKIGTTIK